MKWKEREKSFGRPSAYILDLEVKCILDVNVHAEEATIFVPTPKWEWYIYINNGESTLQGTAPTCKEAKVAAKTAVKDIVEGKIRVLSALSSDL